MRDFNENSLFVNYKDIVKNCINEAYPLPLLLKEYDIPQEYDFGYNEKKRLFDLLSNRKKELLYKRMLSRKRILVAIDEERSEIYNSLEDFYSEELNNFLENYPQYNIICENI